MTARWLGSPVNPMGNDVNSLVSLVRKARQKTVEFEWVLSRSAVTRLQRLVYDSGTRSVGRFRRFDARMLAAINAGLGENDSFFQLKEPSKGQDCTVTCSADGDLFRIGGRASFDTVVGYAIAASEKPWSCEDGALKALKDSAGALGWPLELLTDSRFLAVRNVLFGFSPNYKMERQAASSEPPLDTPVRFHGPFSALGDADCPCLFGSDLAAADGIYLWTVTVNGRQMPWYVGQTRRGFATRIAEHVCSYLSGEYRAPEARALARGKYAPVAGSPADGFWPATLPVFLANWEPLIRNSIEVLKLVRFHVAPVERDKALYDRIEGAIGRHCRNHADEAIKSAFMPGHKLPAFIPGGRPLRLTVTSDAPIAGFPAEILE